MFTALVISVLFVIGVSHVANVSCRYHITFEAHLLALLAHFFGGLWSAKNKLNYHSQSTMTMV